MSRLKGKHLSKPNREFIEGGVRAGRSARGIAAARFKTSPPHSQPRVLALEPGWPRLPRRSVVRRAGGVGLAGEPRPAPGRRLAEIALAHDLGGEFPAVAGRHDPPELLGELPRCFELRIGLLP